MPSSSLTETGALAFTIGPFMLAFILNAYGGLPNSWAYKSSFVAQYGELPDHF
jgi:Na+-translocating ferredoxin:NAD+ oxidoreductase RnfD subunit